ncbi:MAG: NAD(P)-dependent oxidoreductase, partial [Cyclobacteriaceae bacterium]|nr:NAD(P)-dependent oxidoreductase [Cyclobacteriaceae bacterium]
MQLIITGATGSLGGFLTRYFSGLGHDVIACGRDHTPPPNLLRFARYLRADISRPFQLPPADAVIHTAAFSDDKATRKQLYQPNVMGTKYTAEASAHCPTFIHVSSSSVYLPSPELITEDMAGKQDNRMLSPYGHSKLLAEEMLHATSRHARCFVLRPRAFYGAGDRVILPRLLKLVKKGKFSRPGSMQVAVSMTHFENMGHAIAQCLHADQKGTHTYNVADDQPYQLVDVVRAIIRELYGHPLPEKEVPIALLKLIAQFKIGGITPLLVRTFTQDMVLDLSKIRRELGYRPAASFDSKLDELG